MVAVFKKYDFLNASKENESAFGKEISLLEKSLQNPSIDDVKTLIRGLQAATAVPNFPKRHIPGAWMANAALTTVYGIAQ